MRYLVLAIPMALSACANVADYTGVSVAQQICIAAQAGNLNAIEAILAAGLKCLAPVAE